MASVIRYGSARMYASVATSPTVLRSIILVNDVQFGFNVNRSNVKSLGHETNDAHSLRLWSKIIDEISGDIKLANDIKN